MKKITKKYLEENFIGFDKVSKTKNGTFKIRRGYFYRQMNILSISTLIN